MNNITNATGTYDEAISSLDDLLIEGYKIHRDFFADYQERSKEPNFDITAYYSRDIGKYNDWFDQGMIILAKLPLSHYTFHFVKPKIPAGLHLIGLPDNISRIKLHFEYELYALEDIIFRLEEVTNLAVRKEIAEKEYQTDVG